MVAPADRCDRPVEQAVGHRAGITIGPPRGGPDEGSELTRMKSISRRLAATVATVSLLAVGAPVAGASADPGTMAAGAVPSGSVPIRPLLPGGPLALAFTPPSVGPIAVVLGPIIIGGRVINPGLHVTSPGVTLAPIILGQGG